MAIKVTPIYGNGWLGPSNGHIDVPEPFEVEDLTTNDSDATSIVKSRNHLFHGMIMKRSLRSKGMPNSYEPFNIDLFLECDFEGAQVKKDIHPQFSGYALISPSENAGMARPGTSPI